MYFDPLTTWIVALLANGTVLAGEHVSDAEVTQYYKNEVRKSNINLNNEIRRRFANSDHLADFQIRELRRLLNYYKNRFEYRYGAVELDPDVQTLIINLFEKYIVEHKEILQRYEESYNKRKTTEHVSYLERSINEEQTELAFCQQVITAVEEQRRRKKQEEAEKQKAEEKESKSGCFYVIFFVVLIVSIIAFFVDVLS